MIVKGFIPLAQISSGKDNFPMSIVLERIQKYLDDHPETNAAAWSIAAGLDNSTVRHMLKFRRSPRMETLRKLAAAAGEPIEYFTSPAGPEGFAEIQRLFALLTPAEQAMIKTTVTALVAQRRGSTP